MSITIGMSISVPYIKKRGDIFYYVRRIPEAVKKIPNYQSRMGAKNFYQRSLGTKDRDEAVARSIEIDIDFDERVSSVSPPRSPIKDINRAKLMQRHLDEIEVERTESVIAPFRTSLLLADQDPLEYQYLQYKISRLEDEASEIKRAISETGYKPPINGEDSNHPNPIEQAKMLIRDMNLDVSVPSTDFGLVIVPRQHLCHQIDVVN
ncbi:MAG: hypothetical protein GW808_10540 [Sphingomonadales bacterium]|nr:hypothetical protein [Sphingomonadales bacterium]NCO48818.1 hypothetical protein [Sphingomonadales bacterium]NCP01150.1 hypothetical protein [Sphingomonadales bacterium]NCP27048.1 hypothetical protein [Sphingomonadales bacterium]NCP42254.1 hypothetical protein [Sphingomonadales bacterium]